MKEFKYIWLFGLIITGAIIIVPVFTLAMGQDAPAPDPWASVPQNLVHTAHTDFMSGPFESGSDVTLACLNCHPDAATQVMATVHWSWEGDPVLLPGREETVTIGKKHSLNNFCLGIQSNWSSCTSCHAGYGWSDADFDFAAQENVDCLVCHDQTGGYVKSRFGYVAEGVDLLAVAASVGRPTRENCGSCHFNGGGGDAVKHGDLDQTLLNPPDEVDVHMGKHNFQCVDCHRTTEHQIQGRAISVSVDNANQVACTDCHQPDLHADARINAHVQSVACQTCHIPLAATRAATKMEWDWSTAGQDLPEDPHAYLKIKGSFVYEENVIPTYRWHNGTVDRYILGDLIDPNQVTQLNPLLGSMTDPQSKIWPFKIHSALQPYDRVYNYLVQPQTAGEEGYWTTFDWDQSIRLGSAAAGMAYSGEYGFAPTDMNWTLSHLVVPAAQALQCNECHGEEGRMDWEELGYYGDPINWGSRNLRNQ
jgi:octaheme c-type cytochrome (tetrathionate reductase family)